MSDMDRSMPEMERRTFDMDRSIFEIGRWTCEVDRSMFEIGHRMSGIDRSVPDMDRSSARRKIKTGVTVGPACGGECIGTGWPNQANPILSSAATPPTVLCGSMMPIASVSIARKTVKPGDVPCFGWFRSWRMNRPRAGGRDG